MEIELMRINSLLRERRKTIVLADKSDTLLMYLRILLERMGFRIVPLKHGRQLNELVGVMVPDLLLMGTALEDMDGIAALREVRRHGRCSQVPAVLICGDEEEIFRCEEEDLGCVGYLSRPVNIFKLYSLVYESVAFPSGKKRQHLRTPFREKVTLTHGGESAEFWAISLSEGGVFLRSRKSLPANTEVMVVLPLGLGSSLRLPGKVIYSNVSLRNIGIAEPGIAVEFQSVSPEQSFQLLTCVLSLLVGDLLDEQEEPVLSLLSRANDQYQDVIVEQIRLENALKASEVRFRNIVEASPMGILTCIEHGDEPLRVAAANPAAGRILHAGGGDEIVGRPIVDVFPVVPDGDFVDRLKAVCAGGAPMEMTEVRFTDEKGERFLDCTVFRSGPGAGTVIFSDVSRRRAMERDLHRLQKLESVGGLAGGIAHDFNNMLQSISGNIGLARVMVGNPEKETDLKSLLEQADGAVDSAVDLTKQLLTFSRGGDPVRELLSLESIVSDAVALGVRGSNVTGDLKFGVDLHNIMGDRGQLHQVFINLAINAKQAMPDGGTVSISARNVVVKERHPVLAVGDYVLVSVQDHGVGIPGDVLPRIFDPYFTTKEQGSGLGLSTTHAVIQKHGGWISVSSEPRVGTTFNIYIPAASGVAASRTTALSADAIRVGAGRILVMDDEEYVREVFREMLKALGYTSVTVRDGAEMLTTYRDATTCGEPFDAVILDLTVRGGMGGEEAVGKLLEIDPEAKAIAASGYSDSPVLARFQEFGFVDILPKPVKLVRLAGVLGNLFGAETPEA